MVGIDRTVLLASVAGAGIAVLATPAHASPTGLNVPVVAAPTAEIASSAPPETPPADPDTPDIVVTARHQAERAQDVPIALSVLTGVSLERTGSYTLADVQAQTPSLTNFVSNPRNSSIGIRGIGVSSASDGLDTSVGVYIDDVYLGRPGMALADLIDVDRIEVLRGPQGTLFGRNSSAGVLNIATRKPEFQLGGTVEISGGNYGYNQERISLTGPLIDGLLAFRVTGFNTHRDGVLDNITTGIKANSVGRSGGRLQLLATPTSNLTLRLSGDYSQEDDSCCVGATKVVLPASLSATTGRTLQALSLLGYVPVATFDYTRNNAAQNQLTEQGGVSLKADWALGFATLTSISAWRYWHFHPLQDSDGTPLDVIQVNVAQTRDNQFSQELRLASNPGRFTWQAGAYLYHQLLRDHFILNQFGYDASAFYTAYARLANPSAPAINIATGSQYLDDVRTTVDSAAVFGQGNFDLTNRLTLTAGIRYTHDRRYGKSDTSIAGTPNPATSIPFHYDVGVDDDNVSYLVSGTWKFATDKLLYASYSTGYKGSGLNLNSAVSAGTPLVLAPEKVRNWEAGLKTQFLNRRATLNISAFWTDLSGLQANIVPSNGNRSYLANVGDVRSRGLEIDGSLEATHNLTLSANGSLNDAVYSRYSNAPCPVGVTGVCDLTGRPLYQAPKWVANATIDYHPELAGNVQPYVIGQFSYRSSTFGTIDDGPYSRIDAYTLVNFRIGASFAGGRFDLSGWINNAFDKKYFQNLLTTSIVGSSPFAFAGQLGTPRTVGATLRARF